MTRPQSTGLVENEIPGTLRRSTFVAASGNCLVRVGVPILSDDEGGYGRSLVGFDA